MNTVDWYGCYDGSWQSAPLVPEAYAHPAKVSFGLAERIYRHMLADGWLAPGEMVLDPFGGIGGFGFHAALYGMRWVGVELEQKFVDLGNQNLDLWRNRYAPHFPNYGTARLVQGDSRRLVEVVAGAGGVVSSPPYAANISANDAANDSDARRERKAAAGYDTSDPRVMGGPNSTLNKPQNYGTTPGQLGNMPAGVVSSPPFEGVVQHDGGPVLQQGGAMHSAYGTTPGQLGNMPAGVVSSPPYEVTPIAAFDSGVKASGGLGKQFALGNNPGGQSQVGTVGYGDSPGNIANDNANTFWQAAAVIVQQCYDILRPGGYAAWVTGDFVRNRQRVPFGEQWLALCGKVGFEPVLWAVAWKAQHNGTQHGMFGEARELRKTKVSFFRRLANQRRPDTAIENEDVIFVRKPS